MDQITTSIGVGLGLVVLFVALRSVYWRASKKERPVPSELQKVLYLALIVVFSFLVVVVSLRD
jgi:hypothetical protein